MVAASKRSLRAIAPMPPPVQADPIVHGDQTTLQHWLACYWQKLHLPEQERCLLAITQDRREFMGWTGKRLNAMTLGCYCYLSSSSAPARHVLHSNASSSVPQTHRHLIFIEPDMQPQAIEVTVAHELIHLADRVNGTPRRHRHHGYDSIAADEAAITGYSLDELRSLLHEESTKLEQKRRARRPIRYLYECPACGKHYPRTRRYSKAVSCSSCDKHYNPQFRLRLAQE